MLTEPSKSRIVGNSHLILRCQGGLVFSGAHNGQGTITVEPLPVCVGNQERHGVLRIVLEATDQLSAVSYSTTEKLVFEYFSCRIMRMPIKNTKSVVKRVALKTRSAEPSVGTAHIAVRCPLPWRRRGFSRDKTRANRSEPCKEDVRHRTV